MLLIIILVGCLLYIVSIAANGSDWVPTSSSLYTISFHNTVPVICVIFAIIISIILLLPLISIPLLPSISVPPLPAFELFFFSCHVVGNFVVDVVFAVAAAPTAANIDVDDDDDYVNEYDIAPDASLFVGFRNQYLPYQLVP